MHSVHARKKAKPLPPSTLFRTNKPLAPSTYVCRSCGDRWRRACRARCAPAACRSAAICRWGLPRRGVAVRLLHKANTKGPRCATGKAHGICSVSLLASPLVKTCPGNPRAQCIQRFQRLQGHHMAPAASLPLAGGQGGRLPAEAHRLCQVSSGGRSLHCHCRRAAFTPCITQHAHACQLAAQLPLRLAQPCWHAPGCLLTAPASPTQALDTSNYIHVLADCPPLQARAGDRLPARPCVCVWADTPLLVRPAPY